MKLNRVIGPALPALFAVAVLVAACGGGSDYRCQIHPTQMKGS